MMLQGHCGGRVQCSGADGGRRAMDETFWRHRSEEVRGIAETLKTPPAKRDMFVIAAAYARLTRFARQIAPVRASFAIRSSAARLSCSGSPPSFWAMAKMMLASLSRAASIARGLLPKLAAMLFQAPSKAWVMPFKASGPKDELPMRWRALIWPPPLPLHLHASYSATGT
jgi:hypothetical protein